MSAVQTRVEHLETSSTSTSTPRRLQAGTLQGGGLGGDSSQPEDLREVSGGESLMGGTNDPAMLANGVPRPGSLVFYIRLNVVDQSLQPPWEPKTRVKYEGKSGTVNTAERLQ